MINGPNDLEAMGVSPEEMKTPEQRESEAKVMRELVYKRIGQPTAGEEEFGAKIAADVQARLSGENIAIPESVNLSPDEDRLILCTLSNMETEKTADNIRNYMGEILERGMYNFKLDLEQSRQDELVNIAVISQAITDRINQGIDQTMYTQEEIELDERGEYPYEEQGGE